MGAPRLSSRKPRARSRLVKPWFSTTARACWVAAGSNGRNEPLTNVPTRREREWTSYARHSFSAEGNAGAAEATGSLPGSVSLHGQHLSEPAGGGAVQKA